MSKQKLLNARTDFSPIWLFHQSGALTSLHGNWRKKEEAETTLTGVLILPQKGVKSIEVKEIFDNEGS